MSKVRKSALLLTLACCMPLAAQRLRVPPSARQGYPETMPAHAVPQQPAPQIQPARPPASAAPAALPPSLLEKPAQPATIKLEDGQLTITAANSSLNQILHTIATESGMKLDGLEGDQRVFGTFGPGSPREVLSSLLNGTPYNILMAGNLHNGAPRELLLSPASPSTAAAAVPAPAPQPAMFGQPAANEPQDSDAADENPPQEPPAQVYPPEGVAPPSGPPGARTPQQIFEELRRMHEQQNSRPPQQQ